MRVLLISNYAWTVFNFRRRLIGHIESHGHEVFVQTQFDGYEGRLGLRSDHVLPLAIDRKGINPLRDAITVVSIMRAIRAVRADMCLLFTIKPVVYGGIAAQLLSCRYVCNVTGLGTAFLASTWLRKIAELLFRASLRRADRVFFQNQEDRSLFVDRKLVPPYIAALIPGSGVDTSRFSVMPFAGNSAPVFLMVSRLLRDKGVLQYVEAARIVKKKFPAARFQLLGPLNVVNRTAITRDDIQAWVDEKVIEYLGETDDVRPFLRAADCIVLPSYREGTPRSLLEASAIGRPVVASDVPGCRQVLDDGETGFLCRAKDAVDLAAKLERVAQLGEADRRTMGLRGRSKVEREFDEGLVLNQYSAVIGQMMTEWTARQPS